MKISTLIFLSIVFILVLFSITTYINYRQSEEVRDNAEYLALSSVIVRHSNQIQRNILYMERGLRGYLSTGEGYFMQLYDSAATENEALFSELSGLLPPQSGQVKNLDTIRNLYRQWVGQVALPLIETQQNQGRRPPIQRFYEDGQLVQNEARINRQLQQQFRELLNVEYANRENRKKLLEFTESKTKLISFSLTALSIIVGVLIATFLARYIGRRILKLVEMANRIARGNFAVQVKDLGHNEFGILTRSLNNMATVLAENIALLNRKNEELDQFAHIVSHDLKAPLRGIGNVVTWIEEDHIGEIPPKVREYLELIKGRINRLESMIQGILTYARIGRDVHEKEELDLNVLLDEIWQNLSLRPGLRLALQPDLPAFHSEKLPLVQVFTNLLSNAVKYHDKPEGEVRVYCREDRGSYVFFVEDDGPGIARPYHDRIFVIFQTLQARDSFESTGVGLAIVKKILDDRRQQIQLVSEPGHGSIFSFSWPKS